MIPNLFLRSPFLVAAVFSTVLTAGWLQAQNTNLAIGKPVAASGETFEGMVPEHLTDDDPATVSHPLADSDTLGFTYEIDLGREVNLGRVVLVNRTGCCPERLSNYSVRVFADAGGAPGARTWSADLRTDGSDSGDGGEDVLTADLDPEGTFAGRFLHVVNLSDSPHSPQIAEIEAYESLVPLINHFRTDAGNITASGNAALPESATLSWDVSDAESVSISTVGDVGTAGSREVSPDATTTFVLTATNSEGSSQARVTVGVDETTLPPVLTEFMADNATTIDDQEGDTTDWIEVYNPNGIDLSLEGYFLTDDPDVLTKWMFPAGASVPANGFLVVFASGKDITDPSGPLHTNFNLAKPGEYLALIAPDGASVSGQFPTGYPSPLVYPEQKEDFSYGLDPDGNSGFFARPTPGEPNGGSFAGFVEDTKFDFNRGFYNEPIRLTISSATPGATIRYTRDGSTPTETHGTLFTQPIGVSSTMTVRAAAFKEGLAPTNVDTHTYVFVDRVIRSDFRGEPITQELRDSLTAIPSMSIVTPSNINPSSEVATSLEMIFPDGTEGFQEDCGVKMFGGAFTNFEKKNFRMYFRSTYGASKLEYPLFEGFDRGIAAPTKFDQINLRSGSHDMNQRGFYMSNRFTDDTMLDMGNINPHGRFVHLYMNGKYWGQYHLRERWSASTLSQYLGGPKGAYEAINGNWNVGGWADTVIDAYDGDGSAWTRIKRFGRNYEGIQPYLDVEHYIDYMIMWMFGQAEDEYRCVGPADVGSGFKWFLNDSDGYLRTSAGNRTGFASNRPGVFGRSAGDGPGSIFSLLFKEGDPDYRMLLADRIHKHYFNDGAMTPERNIARLQERMDEVHDAFKSEAIRWGYRSHSVWLSEADRILNSWFRTRTAAVIRNFTDAGFYPSVGAPVMNQHGGAVPAGFGLVLSGSRSRFYYTLDGSDPRLPGGDISPTAHLYEEGEAGISLTRNTLVKTRALAGADWSALEEAFFTVGGAAPIAPGELAITELHYNPAGADTTEFIELQNVSDQAINLRGVTFSDGIKFSFADNRDTVLAPGEILLVVDSQFAIDKEYGIGLPIGGVYRGNLDNDGERVAMIGPDGMTLLDFTYNDKSPWPEEADDAGFSLTLASGQSDPADSANWRASSEVGGSPGAVDGVTFTGDPDADEDQDGFNAFAEHGLGTSDADPVDALNAIRLGIDQDGRLTIEFPRNLAAVDVETIVELSSDLLTWTSGDEEVEFVSQVGNVVTYRSISSAIDLPNLFIRLRFNRL